MDFDLSPEQQEFQQVVRSFVEDAVRPNAERWDHEHELPMDAVKQMAELGLFGLPYPEEYGGSGADFLTVCLAIEELARVDSSLAITLEAAVGLGSMPIYRFGTEEQKQKWLVPLAQGEKLASFGLTEPGGGSDAGATRTTATLDGGHWVINGSKAFITNAGTDITSLVTITAVTGRRDDGRKDISTIRVPEANLLGELGRGYAQFLRILDEGRVAFAAMGVGLAQGCVDECLRYTREREAFGHAIGHHQAIQFKLADMETRTHTARLSYYHAASKLLRGEPFTKDAAIAKLVSSGAAMDNARDATQIFGGYGFLNEFPVRRFYRDAKILEIGEGTSEGQKMLIARELGL